MAPCATLGVDRLVRGDRVEPRTEGPSAFEAGAFDVHAQERLLEDVLRHFRTAEVAAKVAEQLVLVATDERFKGLRITPPTEARHEFLVGRLAAPAGVGCSLTDGGVCDGRHAALRFTVAASGPGMNMRRTPGRLLTEQGGMHVACQTPHNPIPSKNRPKRPSADGSE